MLPDYLDDPSVTLTVFLADKSNNANFSRHSDTKVDEMMDQQARAADPKERLKLIRELEAYILHQGYVLPLFWGRRTTVVATELQGYVSAPTNYVGQDLAHLWLKR